MSGMVFGYRETSGHLSHMAVTGLLLVIMGFLTFNTTLVIHVIELQRKRRTHSSLPSQLLSAQFIRR